MSIQISINDAAPVDCAEAGWSWETMARRNMAADVATLRRVRAAREAVEIPAGAKVVLWIDDVRAFTGTAQPAQISNAEGGHRVTVAVHGPWWHLTQLTFCRADLHPEGGVYVQLPPEEGAIFTVPGSGPGVEIWDGDSWEPAPASYTYKWMRQRNLAASPPELDIADYVGARGLICDPDWLASPIYRTLYAATGELLTYVLAVHERLGLSAPFQVDLDQLETDLGSPATPRYRTFQDQRVASVLTALMACKPDVATWFEYDQEVPVLRMRSASLDAEQSLEPGVAPLMRVNATPKPELRPSGIVIRWEDGVILPSAWRGYRKAYYVDKYPATTLPHEPGVATYTLDYIGDIATFKPALAQSLMESMNVLRATGSMSLTYPDRQAAGVIRPGLIYRLSGDPALEAAQLLVQDTTWNISSGQVDCSLGYPRQLDLQTINDLKGWLTWSFTGVFGTVTNLIPPPA